MKPTDLLLQRCLVASTPIFFLTPSLLALQVQALALLRGLLATQNPMNLSCSDMKSLHSPQRIACPVFLQPESSKTTPIGQ